MSNSQLMQSKSAYMNMSASCVARRTLVRPQQGGSQASDFVKQ